MCGIFCKISKIFELICFNENWCILELKSELNWLNFALIDFKVICIFGIATFQSETLIKLLNIKLLIIQTNFDSFFINFLWFSWLSFNFFEFLSNFLNFCQILQNLIILLYFLIHFIKFHWLKSFIDLYWINSLTNWLKVTF